GGRAVLYAAARLLELTGRFHVTASFSVRRALMRGLVVCSAVAAGAAGPAAAQGEQWPAKPLRFIVPYPPGGSLDTMARMLAEKVRAPLGQPVVVENKPGAGGNVGADMAARAQPDGYTLVMGAVATHAINSWLFANLPYDAIKDF